MKTRVFLFGLIFSGLSCNILLEHKHGTSVNIEDSKDRNVFVTSLGLMNSANVENLRIKEIWIEKNWWFGSKYNYKNSKAGKGFQLLITGDSATIWKLSEELEKQHARPPFGPIGQPYRLMISMDSIPKSDTLKITSLVFAKVSDKPSR